MSKIVSEDFNEGNGYYKINLAYLNEEQVEEIESLVSKWNPTDEDIKSCIGMCLTDANEQRFKDYGTNLKQCLAWLEKQGEQPKKHDVCDNCDQQGSCVSPCPMKLIEKQGEQKPSDYENTNIQQMDFAPKSAMEAIKEEKVDNANKIEPKDYSSIDPHFGKLVDKVEPKFHEGDWISGYYTNYKVLSVNNDGYVVEDVEGNKINILFENEKFHHLFTIADAKDGDVLYSPCCKLLWIYKDDNSCYVGNNLSYNENCVVVNSSICIPSDVCPATKEQRDTLIKAMADAGYTFDFEKKELKKVEQKPVWGEEDERMLHTIIADFNGFIRDNTSTLESHFNKCINWLNSLKDRYTWKPSGKQLEALKNAIHIKSFENPSDNLLFGLYEQLKKLKGE